MPGKYVQWDHLLVGDISTKESHTVMTVIERLRRT